MMNIQRTVVSGIFAWLLVMCVSNLVMAQADVAGEIAGTWNAIAEVNGNEQKFNWAFESAEKKLSGTITDASGANPYELKNIKVDGDKLMFEFNPNTPGIPEGSALKVDVVLKDGQLEGKWQMMSADGSALGGGGVTAVKEKGLAGAWMSAAVLPDGTKLETKLMLMGADSDLSGKLIRDDGEVELKEVSRDAKNIKMKFDYQAEGQSRVIEVNAEMASADSLTGKWKMIGDDGAAMMEGEWSASREAEVVVLFDGKSLDQFRGYAQEKIGAGWKIEGETIYFDGTKKSGDLVSKREFENFELEFEWKISEGGNSGVMYRVSLGDRKPYLSGPEYQVLDDDKHKDGEVESKSAGSLYALYVPEGKKLNAVGEWNTSKIVLNGNKVEHWLNGTKVVDAEIASDDWKAKVEASKFKTWEKFGKNSKGHLAFQDHGNKVWYRSIKVKVLKLSLIHI